MSNKTQEIIDEFIQMIESDVYVDGEERGHRDTTTRVGNIGKYYEGCSGYFRQKFHELVEKKGEERYLKVVREVSDCPFLNKENK